ncbi:uncharacterized protein LOC118659597 [Myotis myotis]|uniref:uncharacterized protein LOC118659597 n=1 Tax=Myotis myotis TaxID=51298 RepID=UPI00174C130C|nr:uncharacterized protein LOC118659597 [Myotis myotis]
MAERKGISGSSTWVLDDAHGPSARPTRRPAAAVLQPAVTARWQCRLRLRRRGLLRVRPRKVPGLPRSVPGRFRGARTREEKRPPARQSGRRKADGSTGDIVSGGAETAQAGGPRARPGRSAEGRHQREWQHRCELQRFRQQGGCGAPPWAPFPRGTATRGWHGEATVILRHRASPCGPWDGVIDSSASGGVKDTGRTRLGEAGRAACVRGGEGEQGASRGAAQRPGSERGGRWLRSPWPRRATGGDGAGIGASAFGSETRTSLAGALGAQRPAGLCPLLSGGAHTTLASGPQNPQDDKKWCYPAHAWASDPGLLQVLLALTQEYAALGTTNHPSQESAAKVEQRTEISDTSTTGLEQLPRQHLPPRAIPSWLRPSEGWRPPQPPARHQHPPLLLLFRISCLLSLLSFFLCPWLSRLSVRDSASPPSP